jgi:trk system potassium uptake protein TrkA
LIAVSAILRFIRKGRVVAVQALGDGDAAEVLEFEAQLSSEAVGRELRELRVPRGALIAAIVRNETVLIPRGATVIEEGDHIVVLAQKAAVGSVSQLLRSQEAGA